MAVQEYVLNEIRRMSATDLVDLVRALAVELETSDARAVTTAGPAGEPVQIGPSDEVAASLRDFGSDRIAIIKAAREATELGLREAQSRSEASPSAVRDWGHDSADGPEPAGVPVKPRTPLPSDEASEQLDIPLRPRQAA